MKKILINFLLLISGIAVIYVFYALTALLQIVENNLIETNTNELLTNIVVFFIGVFKYAGLPILAIFGIYFVTSRFINLQVLKNTKFNLSFFIFTLLCTTLVIFIILTLDSELILQFKFITAIKNCDIKKYSDLVYADDIYEFIEILLTNLFNYIQHIVLTLFLIWSCFFTRRKLHDYCYSY